MRIRDVALKTCQRRWTIGRSRERGSGISALALRHDDDEYITFPKFLIFSWFGSSIPSVIYHFPLLIISRAHFLCQIPSLYSDCISSLLALRFTILFSFLGNGLMSSMYISWLIFSCYSRNLYLPMHFQNTWLSGINAITNSNGDSATTWNIPLWIFTSAKLYPPLQFFMVFLNELYWLRVFKTVNYPALNAFFNQSLL